MYEYLDLRGVPGFDGNPSSTSKRADHSRNTIFTIDTYNNVLEELVVEDAPVILQAAEIFEVNRDMKGSEKRFEVVGYTVVNNINCYLLKEHKISKYRDCITYSTPVYNGDHTGKIIKIMPIKPLVIKQIELEFLIF